MIHNILLDNKRNIKSKYLDDTILNLADKTFTIPWEYEYKVVETSERSCARPDQLSLDVYGDPMYADLICKLNDVSNPFEMNEKQRIILPDMYYINFFRDYPVEDEEDEQIERPKPKQPKEKRASNEAIVGDKRFKIDTEKRLIIY